MKSFWNQFGTGLSVLTVIFLLYFLLESLSRYNYKRTAHERPAVDWTSVEDTGKFLEISWMGPPFFPSGREGGHIETLLEQRYNLEFNPIFLDSKGHERKKPLILASGRVPDGIYIGNPVEVRRYVDHGLISEVPFGMLLRHAPTYVKTLNHYAPFVWLYSNVAGKNYGIPTLYLSGSTASPGLWRKDWLKAVGITEEPQTIDDFHEAFRAFTFEDPDGNGIDDTYGLSFDTQRFFNFFGEFFAAFGVLPFEFEQVGAGILYGGLRAETHEALAVLRSWFKEGIIDPEFVIDQQGQNRSLQRKFLTGRIGYLPKGGEFNNVNRTNPLAYIYTLKKVIPDGEFAISRFPVGPRGESGQRVWSRGGNIICMGNGVTEQPEKLVRILTMLEDFMNDFDLWLEAKSGKRGLHWEFTGPDYRFGEQRQLIPPYSDKGNAERAVINLGGGFFNPFPGAPGMNEKLEGDVRKEYLAHTQAEEYGRSSVFGKNDVLPSAALYLDDLNRYQKTTFVKIIRGDLPLDYFEVFKRNWLNRGGAVLLQEAAELHALQSEIYETVGYRN